LGGPCVRNILGHKGLFLKRVFRIWCVLFQSKGVGVSLVWRGVVKPRECRLWGQNCRLVISKKLS
jgi:hypothetical protein